MPADQWAVANLKAEISSVQISSPPVVNFKVTDANGAPIKGLGSTSQGATATLPGLTNLSFSLAKLVPGGNGSPSNWVNYVVTTVPTYTDATKSAVRAATPTRPTTDNTGTLVDNGDGSYSYTFYRDVTTIKDQVATMTVTSPANKGDLGDLTYDPTLPHRVTLQISGAARGTGSNTADGVTVTPAVNLENPVNVVYDFIPSTGKAIAAADSQRELVSIDSCNSCHEKLAFHGGGRVDTRYCVVCHTDQRKYGYADVASTDGKFPALTETKTVNALTGITSYSYTPQTRSADGEIVGNFTTMIHKIHQGKDLVKENYHYAGIVFNNKGFSMLGGGQKMCSTCHDNTKAVNADNWKTQPSQKACGSCHDGINFKTGLGSTLADKAAATAVDAILAESNHLGGTGLADDTTCAGCHKVGAALADVTVVHRTENVTKHNPTIAAGLATFEYDIKSAKVETNKDITIEFGIKKNGALATLPMTGFSGGPSFLLAYATPQDGIAVPVDYDNSGRPQAQAISVSLASLLASSVVVPSTVTTGYYKATIKATITPATSTTPEIVVGRFPDGAVMRTVAMQAYYTQTKGTDGIAADTPRHAISVVKTVTGDTARRTVVDPAKCSNCHEWFEGHGGNRVYETQVCVMCHTPGLATSGRGIDKNLATFVFSAADEKKLADWKFDRNLTNAALNFPVTTNNFKDMIHGIHAGRDRVTPFMDVRDSGSRGITLLDMRRMDFPGVLNKCSTCHTSTTSATTTYNTVPSNGSFSTYESIDSAYSAAIGLGTATPALAKAALSTVSNTDNVTTPYAAACVSCHDNKVTNAHVVQNGGLVKVSRSAAKLTVESCATCHGPGRTYDAAVVHK
jgi:OmcA/MtrC family decaheme c-type cytochrome